MNVQQHELAASAVQAKRRELEQRLKEVSEAPPFAKALPMRLTAAAFFELLDHQAAFNQHTIARLAELEAELESHQQAHQDGRHDG